MTAQSTADKLRRLQNRVAYQKLDLDAYMDRYGKAWSLIYEIRRYVRDHPDLPAPFAAELFAIIDRADDKDSASYKAWNKRRAALHRLHRAALKAQRAKQEKAEAKP